MDSSPLIEQLHFAMPDLSLSALLIKLGLAMLSGIYLSLLIRYTTPVPDKQKKRASIFKMQYTHILLCVTGSFMMIIIGNNLANAFGLTGVISMIRFRTSLVDPKDLALIVIIVAVGMGLWSWIIYSCCSYSYIPNRLVNRDVCS